MHEQARLLTITDAAAVLGVARSFLYQQTRQGPASKVPFVRVGRFVRFRREDLEAWIIANTVGGRPCES